MSTRSSYATYLLLFPDFFYYLKCRWIRRMSVTKDTNVRETLWQERIITLTIRLHPAAIFMQENFLNTWPQWHIYELWSLWHGWKKTLKLSVATRIKQNQKAFWEASHVSCSCSRWEFWVCLFRFRSCRKVPRFSVGSTNWSNWKIITAEAIESLKAK
jgi:hypothetical protein